MFEIYITTNLINQKKYIGQHKKSKNQYKDKYYLGSGTLLKKAIEKYGSKNFKREILEECETQEEANSLEKYYIKQYNAVEDPNFYNLSPGGQDGGGFLYYQQQLRNDPEKYRKHEEKRLQGMAEYRKNNPEKMSELGKKNIKKCHQWLKEHPEVTATFGNGEVLQKWMKEHPEEYKKNIEKGFKALEKWKLEHPGEVKKNLSLGPQANKEKSGKKIRCINNGKIFNSIKEAEQYYDTYKDAIGRCLRGKLKTAGTDPETGERLKWEYYEQKKI